MSTSELPPLRRLQCSRKAIAQSRDHASAGQSYKNPPCRAHIPACIYTNVSEHTAAQVYALSYVCDFPICITRDFLICGCGASGRRISNCVTTELQHPPRFLPPGEITDIFRNLFGFTRRALISWPLFSFSSFFSTKKKNRREEE